ncbi:hypothetical protein Tco_0671967 [Tanacetum coccineum]
MVTWHLGSLPESNLKGVNSLSVAMDWVLVYVTTVLLCFKARSSSGSPFHSVTQLLMDNLITNLCQGDHQTEFEHVVMNSTPAGMRHHHLHLYIQRISLTGFPAQCVGSSITDELDLTMLALFSITGYVSKQDNTHYKSLCLMLAQEDFPSSL